MNPDVFVELRKKIKYQIITICENSKIIDKEDLLLFIMGKKKDRTLRIYWGADFDLLKPEKSNVITILVDHQYYGDESSNLYQKDKTNTIIQSLLKYKNAGHNIIINHIGTGKINEVTDNYITEKFYHLYAMDFRYIYKYYNKADIFVVTHPESFGLSTIECAAAGALIVQPDGYIKKEIISLLNHVCIPDTDNIDWTNIISQINIGKSIQHAKKLSYENAVNNLYKRMKTVSTLKI